MTNQQVPRTAIAVHLDRYGPPSALVQRDLAVPVAADDEVLLRVHAAGINRGDALAIEGLPYVARLSYGVRGPKRPVPGTDVAGTVEAVGRDVATLKPGDQVIGWATGAFAPYAVAPASSVMAKPAGVSFDDAAASPTAAVTALQALVTGRVEAGSHVLVIGASGGVGSFAVQLAKVRGAEVTGVASTCNLHLVRSLGAHHVIDYTAGGLTDAHHRYDAVIDLAGRHSLRKARRLLAPRGRYVVVGGGNPRSLTGMHRFAAAVALSPFGTGRLRPLFATPDRDDLEQIVPLLASGHVRPFVEAAYDLRDAADAICFVHQGHARGKVVLRP